MVKGMILGIDFSKDYTQMAYLDEKGNPKSLSFGTADNFLIPTVACYHKELKEWYAGEEAVNKKTGENCVFYEKLPELSSEKSGEKNIELIQSYLSHLLQWAQAGQEKRKIKNIVITLEEVRPDLLEVITEALLRLGYPSEDIKIISHSESLVYYMLNQNREIWINQVYYLHMNDEQFSLRQLKVLHGRGPSVAYVDMEDLTQLVSMKTVTENPRHADEILASYLEERFGHLSVGRRVLRAGLEAIHQPDVSEPSGFQRKQSDGQGRGVRGERVFLHAGLGKLPDFVQGTHES